MPIAMLKLARLLMWKLWSTFWNLVLLSKNIVYQSLLGFRRTGATPRDVENVEHCGDGGEQPLNSDNAKLLKIGIFAAVYLLDDAVIRKLPRGTTCEDALPITREAMVYSIIGKHPRIAECLSLGRTDLVDTRYYSNGDLAAFISNRANKLGRDLQRKWFRQIIEAVYLIHEHDIVHSDLALRQFFLDDNLNVRLGDFNSAQCPGHLALGYEKASHCLPRDYEAPNSVASDLFALASTLYELLAGKAPYSELYQTDPQNHAHSGDHSVIRARIQHEQQVDREIENLYKNQRFPDVNGLWGGSIILGCWKGTITTAEEALNLCLELENMP
ncbi:kinase-like protein [Aspergillus indologenus CBS 114.80]|uniref:Kinase-like protein n=1 Tax=Aspergillus indologenus CBS 114.80 TaxID=1450541 RepID=A0A2V5HVZ5_9EURO|nr:kinase-like protein [Aspergillus indologenus CBS 114.80]